MPSSSRRRNGSTTLEDFVQQNYLPRKVPNASHDTKRIYRYTLLHFSRFLGRTPRLKDLTEDRLVAFLAWLPDGRAPATCNSYMYKLLALARCAFRKGMLKQEPEIQLLQEPKRVVQAYKVEEIGQILWAIQHTEQGKQVAGIPGVLWWTALVQTIYWTGLRIGATLQIPRSNVNLREGSILVLAETQKQNSDQLLRVHQDCVEAIEAIWQPEQKLLFPWSYTKSTLYRRFHGIIEEAGLPTSNRDKFQKIRRSTYSYSKLGGIDAGHQLGHHSDQSSRYEDPTITCERQACDVLPTPRPPPPRLRVVG